MKKKHKTGYRAGNDVKTPFPIKKPFPNGKPPILWVKKNGKVVKATDEEIKLAKAPKGSVITKGGKEIPKIGVRRGHRWIMTKKGGKIK